MRTLVSGERTTIAAQAVKFATKVEVENVDGTWVDVSGRFVSADITTDVDQPVWSAVIAFARDDAANTASLSPLRGDSTLNVDDSAVYAPLLTAGREIRVSVATVAPSTTPGPSDYRYIFWGRIDKPAFGTTPMTVECRDLGGMLIDTIISETVTYGDEEAGVPVAQVMQQILDDVLGENAPTLVDISGTDFVVTTYTPLNVPVMEAMTSLALKAGGLVARYRLSDAGVPEFTLYDPVRAKVTPDATIPPTEYLEVPEASIDSANVRNRIRGQFLDPVTGEILTLEVEDTSSQNAGFGVRFMQLGADVFDGLTANEVLAVINSALSDLKYPKFDKVVGCLLFWPAEVGDLYRFTANAVHYDDDQDLGVMGIAHHLEQGHGTTRFTCRGTPAGAYLEWIRRQGTGPQGPLVPPAPEFLFLLGEATQFGGTSATVDGAGWLGYRMRGGVDEIRVHVLQGDGQEMPVPNIDGTTLALVIRRPEGDIGRLGDPLFHSQATPGEYASMALLSTHENFFKRIVFYGVRGGLTSLPVIPRAFQAVDPNPVRVDGTIASIEVVRDGTTNTVTVTPGTLDTVNPGNWLVIVRNQHILPPIFIATSTDPVVFEDTGLPEAEDYTAVYDAFIWNGGQSGKRFRAIAAPPTITLPEWADGTPRAVIESNVPKIKLSWTATTPGASAVRVEASLDGTTIRVVGSGDLAAGTIYDSNTDYKLYRLCAVNIVGVRIATTPWKRSEALPPILTIPGAVPQFILGTPKAALAGDFFDPRLVLQISWRCATPGARELWIEEADASGGPWSLVGDPTARFANVSEGTWRSRTAAPVDVQKFYRLVAVDASFATLATSAAVEYIPS